MMEEIEVENQGSKLFPPPITPNQSLKVRERQGHGPSSFPICFLPKIFLYIRHKKMPKKF